MAGHQRTCGEGKDIDYATRPASPFLPNPALVLLINQTSTETPLRLNLTSSLNSPTPLALDDQIMPSKTQATSEELLDEPPTSINPYQVLDVEKDATLDRIKSAYRKAALQWHPGMNNGCTPLSDGSPFGETVDEALD